MRIYHYFLFTTLALAAVDATAASTRYTCRNHEGKTVSIQRPGAPSWFALRLDGGSPYNCAPAAPVKVNGYWVGGCPEDPYCATGYPRDPRIEPWPYDIDP